MEQQFDPDKPMCQDDYEYFGKLGEYAPMKATLYPTFSHPRIVIGLHLVGNESWPTSAVALTTDDDERDWFGLLCATWPAEPGHYWQRDDEQHASVRRL